MCNSAKAVNASTHNRQPMQLAEPLHILDGVHHLHELPGGFGFEANRQNVQNGNPARHASPFVPDFFKE
jgi:hypothetical protein